MRDISIASETCIQTSNKNSVPLYVQWDELQNMNILATGGSSLIYTAIYHGRSVIIKTINPKNQEFYDSTLLEEELEILLQINHPSIISLYGAGFTPCGERFLILENLEGGTLENQLLNGRGNSQRPEHFFRNKTLPLKDVVMHAKSIAEALAYCHHSSDIDGGMILHRDLKPDNIGFTSDGILKLFDFGLSCKVQNSFPNSDKVFELSGGTGSLRYMAPEVAEMIPYNHKADVFSFGIILWELLSCRKPYVGLSIEDFYEKVVYGGLRPPISNSWPIELVQIMQRCWSSDMKDRPNFGEIKVELQKFSLKAFSVARIPVLRRSSLSARRRFSMT